MPGPARRADHGFTLVEATIVLSVVVITFLTGLKLLGEARTASEHATSGFVSEDRGRGALSGTFDVLAETSILNLDTAMRVHGPVLANDIFSDRFVIPGVTLRQCTNPTCAFHTRDDLTVFRDRLECGYEFRTGLLGGSITRGKNWPAPMSACPLDGWALSTAPRLDGAKFFIARTESGTFTKTSAGKPFWSGLVFLFPCTTYTGRCELRRYDVYVSDLMAGTVTFSAGWSRFPPTAPSMIDLFDFGTDGLLTGVPDGKVPLTNATSDAKTESFTVGTYLGEPTILVTKDLPVGPLAGGYPKRQLTLRINLETGETDFSVEHRETSTVQWIASSNFVRMPKTLVQGLTELAISTAVSDPYNAMTNPTGLSEPNVVRITVGTSESPEQNQWVNHIETFKIATRN
jgi:hypothetical protein